jgi:hypothetical protein
MNRMNYQRTEADQAMFLSNEKGFSRTFGEQHSPLTVGVEWKVAKRKNEHTEKQFRC